MINTFWEFINKATRDASVSEETTVRIMMHSTHKAPYYLSSSVNDMLSPKYKCPLALLLPHGI